MSPVLPRRLAVLASLTTMVSTLTVGCGGDPTAHHSVQAGAAASPPAAAGGPRPDDPGAHTFAGLYTTREQAERLAQAGSGDVLWVEIGCCGEEAVEQALGIAYALQAAQDLPASAPVLVRSPDLRLAAAVANRLTLAGHGRVWLVTR